MCKQILLYLVLLGIKNHQSNGQLMPYYRTISLVSFVTNFNIENNCTTVKLSDFYRKLIVNNTQLLIIEKIKNSFKSGNPLLFNIINNTIVNAEIPSKNLAKAYLNSYDNIEYIDFKSYSNLEQNVDKIKTYNCLFRKFNQMIKDTFKTSIENVSLDYGCEFRCGVIANFLENSKIKNHCKLFIDGEINYKFYKWLNHTVNILAIEINRTYVLYVFDPFVFKHILNLKNYLNILQLNGSKNLNLNFTYSNVYLPIKNTCKGIIDIDNKISIKIFKQEILKNKFKMN